MYGGQLFVFAFFLYTFCWVQLKGQFVSFHLFLSLFDCFITSYEWCSAYTLGSFWLSEECTVNSLFLLFNAGSKYQTKGQLDSLCFPLSLFGFFRTSYQMTFRVGKCKNLFSCSAAQNSQHFLQECFSFQLSSIQQWMVVPIRCN